MNNQSPVTLLIVDDEQEIRTGLRSIIPWEQYAVSVIGTSSNGADALNKIRYYEPDIVITDIQMPGMNGLELVHRAKEEQFHCSFVILSGYDDFQYAKTAIRYGVSDYLLKPISIKELTDLIQKLTEKIYSRRFLHKDQLSALSELRTAKIFLKQYNLIPQLLHREISASELEQSIQDYSLTIRNTTSCAVLIKVFAARQNDDDSQSLCQVLAPLKQLLEQQLQNTGYLLSELPSEGLLLVINLPFTAPDGMTLEEMLIELIRSCSPSDSIRIVAAIGSASMSLLDIDLSCQAARQIISWHIYPELGAVLNADLLDIKPPAIIMPGDDIWDAVLKNSPEDISMRFKQYLQMLLSPVTPPPSYIYSMCNYLIIMIHNQITLYLGDSIQNFTGSTYATLQNLYSVDDIEHWMCEVLCSIASEVQISRATKNDPLIEKAISYIHLNLLHNPHTDDVCGYLGLSKSYFSTYFKNKTQITFRDYILNLKINYAQEQLKHPEHSPTEVSLILGYEDYRSFSRAFKARTGFSPSDYQSQFTSSERYTP